MNSVIKINFEKKKITAKNFPAVVKTVPNEIIITIYGAAATEPILADEKKVDDVI